MNARTAATKGLLWLTLLAVGACGPAQAPRAEDSAGYTDFSRHVADERLLDTLVPAMRDLRQALEDEDLYTLGRGDSLIAWVEGEQHWLSSLNPQGSCWQRLAEKYGAALKQIQEAVTWGGLFVSARDPERKESGLRRLSEGDGLLDELAVDARDVAERCGAEFISLFP